MLDDPGGVGSGEAIYGEIYVDKHGNGELGASATPELDEPSTGGRGRESRGSAGGRCGSGSSSSAGGGCRSGGGRSGSGSGGRGSGSGGRGRCRSSSGSGGDITSEAIGSDNRATGAAWTSTPGSSRAFLLCCVEGADDVALRVAPHLDGMEEAAARVLVAEGSTGIDLGLA